MALQNIPWIQATEQIVGASHPTLTDVENRPLRTLLTLIGLNPDQAFTGLVPVYNIKSASAAVDGATDDLAIVNSVVAAIPNTGGTLHFAGGTTLISGHIVIIGKDNLRIQGTSWGNSLIKMKNGVANPGFVIELYDCTNTEICNLGICGNRDNLAGGYNEFNGGIRWGANGGQVRANENFRVTGVHVYNVAGDCIMVTGSAGATTIPIRGVIISDCVLEDPNPAPSRQCIAIVSGKGIQITDNTLRGSTTGYAGQWGIDLESDSSPTGLTIQNVTIGNNDIFDCNGIRMTGASSSCALDTVSVDGNTIRTHATAAQAGISTGSYCSAVDISDNQIFVQEAGATGFGIQMDIGGTGITVDNNDIKVLSTGAAGNGIQMAGSADLIDTTGFKITNNHVHHCTYHGIVAKRLYTQINNNYCRFNGGDGIRLAATTDGASGSVVEGNISILNTGWGITIEATVTDYTVMGNNVQSNTAGSIQDLSRHASRMVAFNKGHPLWDRQAAAPATGTWAVGDIVYNSAPASAGFIGWVCTAAGTPGTWKTWGLIS